jgi:hypothetical protein
VAVTGVTVNRTVFWVLTPCSLKSAEPELSCLPVSDGLLLGLLFDHEYGGDIFFRNAWLSPSYTALPFRRHVFFKICKKIYFSIHFI